MTQHIAEWYRGQWQPVCQVFGPMFGIKPHGYRGRGRCRACQQVMKKLG